jgi:hypothetical protein
VRGVSSDLREKQRRSCLLVDTAPQPVEPYLAGAAPRLTREQ